MGLEINTNEAITSQIYTGMTREQACKSGNEILSIFDEANTDGNDVINENELDAYNLVKTQPKADLQDEPDTTPQPEEAEAEDKQDAQTNLKAGSKPKRKRHNGIYKGEVELNPVVSAGYASDKGLLLNGIYEVAYKDVKGIENLNLKAGVYTDFSTNKAEELYSQTTVGSGIQASIEYHGELEASNMHAYGVADTKIGYNFSTTDWSCLSNSTIPGDDVDIRTRSHSFVTEEKIHGGFRFKKTIKKIKSETDGYFGGYAGVRITTRNAITTSRTPGTDAPNIPEEINPAGTFVNPLLGFEAGYAYTTKKGSKISAEAFAGVKISSKYQNENYFMAIPNKDINLYSGDQKVVSPHVGLTLTFKPGYTR